MGCIVKGILGILGLLIIIAIFAGGVGDRAGSPRTERSFRDSDTSSSYKTPPSYGPKLEVLSWNCGQEYGYISVQGRVKNISGKRLENVMVVGTFETAAGEFVKSTDALIDYNPILPGQTSPFKALTTTNPAIKSCSIAFRHLWGSAIRYTAKTSQSDERREQIKQAQRLLNALGYNAGTADGISGPKTRAAVRAFQTDRGMTEIDGKIDDGLLQQLRKAR